MAIAMGVVMGVVRGRGGARLLLCGDEVDNGCDDSAVFGLPIGPVHGGGVSYLLLQERVQL